MSEILVRRSGCVGGYKLAINLAQVDYLRSWQFTASPRPVAQLVEHRVVVREVVSSTPAGPTLRVLK